MTLEQRAGGRAPPSHLHEEQAPVEVAARIGLRLQTPEYPIDHIGLEPEVDPTRHGPAGTVARPAGPPKVRPSARSTRDLEAS